MIYEKRTYTINPLKMADWLALYQSDALAVQTDHLGQLIGFFFTEIGVVNQVVHIWAYESLDDRLVRRARMAQDERWQTFSRKNRELAAVERLESVLSLIHISEPTRLGMISYAVFCLKKKKRKETTTRICRHNKNENQHRTRKATQTYDE